MQAVIYSINVPKSAMNRCQYFFPTKNVCIFVTNLVIILLDCVICQQ